MQWWLNLWQIQVPLQLIFTSLCMDVLFSWKETDCRIWSMNSDENLKVQCAQGVEAIKCISGSILCSGTIDVMCQCSAHTSSAEQCFLWDVSLPWSSLLRKLSKRKRFLCTLLSRLLSPSLSLSKMCNCYLICAVDYFARKNIFQNSES